MLDIRTPSVKDTFRIKNPKLHKPKLPKLKPNTNLINIGLVTGARGGLNTLYELNTDAFSLTQIREKTGAGRGGIHYSKTSSMAMIAESGVKQTRTKKERTPYKPTPQIHALHSLRYIREFGATD